jgi:hypothetical protein
MANLKAHFKSAQPDLGGSLPGQLIFGIPGKDGLSPIAKVTQTDDGAVITITDKNGTTEAVVKNGKDSGVGENGVVLTDDATGKNYKIFVSDGKLTMDLMESGAGSAELTLADQNTGKKYKIYVSSGKLTMEEV